MAFQSQFHMPGTYQGDGVHPDIFRTPAKSPCSASSSGYLPSRTTVTGIEDDACTKRKRLHDDGFSARIRGQGQQDAPNVFNNPFLQHTTQGPSALRPYALAGNLHTPSSEYNDGSTVMGESLYSDSDYRRMLGTKRPREDVDMASIQPLSLQPIQQQHYSDQQQQEMAQAQGWGAFAFATLGGVVGRLWEFCKAGTFKGFHAGGGGGYDVAGGAGDVPRAPHDIFNAPDLFQKAQQAQPPSSSELPREPPNEFSQIDSRSSSPVAPAAKRRQTEFSEELGRNWVMVGNSDPRRQTISPYRTTPRNRNHAPSITTGRRISTPNARRSMASQVPLLNTTPTSFEPRQPSSASYASPRSPSPTKIPNPAASDSFSAPRNHSSHRPRPSIGSTPKPSHRRTNSGASVASARVSRSFNEETGSSPRLDAEARKLAARRRRDDDDTDFRIEAFNKQLQDMIRQGKEALGTTIEVENGEAEGEGGWEDYDGM